MRRLLIPIVVLCTVLPATVALLQETGEGRAKTAQAEGDAPIYVMPKSGPFAPETVAIPQNEYISAWARSGHSNASSTSFSLSLIHI